MKWLQTVVLLLVASSLFAQLESQVQSQIESDRSFVVQLGVEKNNKFIEIGSGIMCYISVDTMRIPCVISAKHVLKVFLENSIPYIDIRPSWADSIKTNEYAGIHSNLVVNNLPVYFTPIDTNVDLSCIILGNADKVSEKYYSKNKLRFYPYNSIYNPKLGEDILVYGYPAHIENSFAKFDYSVCTLKPGVVSWISLNKINTEIDNFLLIEANATHGNSGGPVFSKPVIGGVSHFVGIVSGGFDDDAPLPLKIGNKILTDSLTKQTFYVVPKSGVTLIVKAEAVRNLLNQVDRLVNSNMAYKKLFSL